MSATQTAPYLSYELKYTLNITEELVRQHKQAWQKKGLALVSAILYGPLAAGEYDEDIQLLEIVKGFPQNTDSRPYEFPSTRQFPMYGRLRLRVMSPEEFKASIKNSSALISEVKGQMKILRDQGKFAEKLLTQRAPR